MEIPESVITVKFPFPVQTSPSDHVIVGYSERNVGCKVLKIVLPAVRKSYSKMEKLVNFEN